jgi:hypothetical protein
LCLRQDLFVDQWHGQLLGNHAASIGETRGMMNSVNNELSVQCLPKRKGHQETLSLMALSTLVAILYDFSNTSCPR